MLLIFQAGEHSRMAVSLSSVVRLEEIPRTAVEKAGGQEVVQYRGQIMPLSPSPTFWMGAWAGRLPSGLRCRW